MKKTEIVTGAFYDDGKMGIREILDIGSQIKTLGNSAVAVGVHYRVISSLKTALISTDGAMELDSFAAWAKNKISEQEATQQALSFQAMRIVGRLTEPQLGLFKGHDISTSKSHIECSQRDMRVVQSCIKKVLVNQVAVAGINSTLKLELTPLGTQVLLTVHGINKSPLW